MLLGNSEQSTMGKLQSGPQKQRSQEASRTVGKESGGGGELVQHPLLTIQRQGPGSVATATSDPKVYHPPVARVHSDDICSPHSTLCSPLTQFHRPRGHHLEKALSFAEPILEEVRYLKACSI